MKGRHKGWFKNVVSNLKTGWRFLIAGWYAEDCEPSAYTIVDVRSTV